MRPTSFSTFSTLAAAAVITLAAPHARADVVKLDKFTFGPASTLTVNSPIYSGEAGQFSGTRNGSAFLTFCTDLLQTFNFGVTYSNYSVVSGVTAFGAAKSQALDQAMSAFMAPGALHDAASSATAQAMIWEILYEKSGNFDLSTGTFKATSTGSTQTAMNAMTWASLTSTPIRYHVDQLFSATNQDFLVVSAVPEPGSIALVATALFGLAVARRRNKSR